MPKKISLKQFLMRTGKFEKVFDCVSAIKEGLIIITNDGKLSSVLMKPDSGIEKKYYAVLEKPIGSNKIRQLENGIEINIDNQRYRTMPCKISTSEEKGIYISISEGKKRQIRKMLEAVGNKVVYLKRVSIGGLSLEDLKTGELKQITKEEIMEKLNF